MVWYNLGVLYILWCGKFATKIGEIEPANNAFIYDLLPCWFNIHSSIKNDIPHDKWQTNRAKKNMVIEAIYMHFGQYPIIITFQRPNYHMPAEKNFYIHNAGSCQAIFMWNLYLNKQTVVAHLPIVAYRVHLLSMGYYRHLVRARDRLYVYVKQKKKRSKAINWCYISVLSVMSCKFTANRLAAAAAADSNALLHALFCIFHANIVCVCVVCARAVSLQQMHFICSKFKSIE